MFQTGGEEASDGKWNVDTLIYDIVSRPQQWGRVGSRRAGEQMWLGPSLDLAKFHVAPQAPVSVARSLGDYASLLDAYSVRTWKPI